MELLWETTTNVQIKKSIFKSITVPWFIERFWRYKPGLILGSICCSNASVALSKPSMCWQLPVSIWTLAVGKSKTRANSKVPGDVWTLVWRSSCLTNHSLAGWTAPCNEDTLELIDLFQFAYSFTKQTNKCQRLNTTGASLALTMATQKATRASNDELNRQPLKRK